MTVCDVSSLESPKLSPDKRITFLKGTHSHLQVKTFVFSYCRVPQWLNDITIFFVHPQEAISSPYAKLGVSTSKSCWDMPIPPIWWLGFLNSFGCRGQTVMKIKNPSDNIREASSTSHVWWSLGKHVLIWVNYLTSTVALTISMRLTSRDTIQTYCACLRWCLPIYAVKIK